MLLAKNIQHKEITKNKKTQQDRQNQHIRTKWAYTKLPTYKTLYKIIRNTPNAKMLKSNFYLLSNLLILFNKRRPLLFKRIITLTI